MLGGGLGWAPMLFGPACLRSVRGRAHSVRPIGLRLNEHGFARHRTRRVPDRTFPPRHGNRERALRGQPQSRAMLARLDDYASSVRVLTDAVPALRERIPRRG